MTVPSQVSYVSGTSDKPLLGDTIGDDFDRTVAAHGDRDALVDRATGRRWTYRELADEVDAVALGLVDLGVTKGDRVGIWSPNCAEWVFTQYATAKIGAILVNINPAYRAHELGTSSTRPASARSSPRELQDLRLRRHDRRGPRGMPAAGGRPADRRDRVDRPAVGRPGRVRRAPDRAGRELSADDPINIQYTSGTTGFPKGATLSHHNILNNGYFVGELCSYTEHDRVCIPVPFYHCFGMVMGNLACTSHGASMVIPAPAFDPRPPSKRSRGAVHVAVRRADDVHRRARRPGLRVARPVHAADRDHGGLAVSDRGDEAGHRADGHGRGDHLLRHDRDVARVHQTRADDSVDRRVSTVGRVHPHLEVKIVDPETGLTVPCGTPGEFCTRGYSVMLGYWDQPDKTAEAIDDAGWMHTGDLAVMDEDGYVKITGRIKDMVIRGGENIYPREIEEFLYTHPDIQDVQVIGVPDEKYGEELMAWVKMREGATALTAESLREYCTGKLAHYKIPRYVHIVDEFPMTVTGKMRKVEMREVSVELLDLGKVAAAKHA